MKKMLLFCSIFLLTNHLIFSQIIPNAGFENWTESEPDGWITNNFIFPMIPGSDIIPVTKSNESYSGESAAKLELVPFMVGEEERVYAAQIFTNRLPLTGSPATFDGYFQFHPQTNNDSLSILVILFGNNKIVASALLHVKEAISSYTKLSIPFFYFPPVGVPDSAEIMISISANTTSDLNSIGTYALIDDVSFEGIATSADMTNINLPSYFEMKQNYPNPFNPLTKIEYSIPYETFVELKIYDMLGNEITTLVNENQKMGKYSIDFDGSKLSSGIYLAKISAGNFIKSIKMILLK